jgi:hypothetical protein
MARRGDRDPAKERFWRRILQRWRRSQLSIRAFCARHQLSEPSFYSWRSIIAKRDHESEPNPAPLTPRRPTRAQAAPPPFVPVRVVPAPAAIEVVLGNGRVLRLGHDADLDQLRQLLAVLEEPPC